VSSQPAPPARALIGLAGEVAQLYAQEKQYAEIGEALNLTKAHVHKTLNELFAEGMPKLERRSPSEGKVRAIHAAYVRGDGSIENLAEAIGFTRSTARARQPAPKPTRSRAHAEQRVITALLMARVDELRKPRALSLERLANASDLSIGTLHHLRGELTDPRLSTVLRLCRGLGVTARELLDDLPLPVEPRPRHARTPAQAGADT
jgi:DNA-binding Xre family transcriptional regulator